MRGGESKIIKGIQDKETFTRTKCTSTVIYKYSSPSSFQLRENKNVKNNSKISQHREQIHVVAVPHCPLHLKDCTYIQVQFRFELQWSDTPLQLLTWPLPMDGMHTLSHTNACETAEAHTHHYICTRIRQHTRVFQHKSCLPIIAVKALPWGFALTMCAFTSLHLPLCNIQALKYHQTNRGQGICVAFPGRRHVIEIQAPSSLSSSYASPPPDLLGTEGRMR